MLSTPLSSSFALRYPRRQQSNTSLHPRPPDASLFEEEDAADYAAVLALHANVAQTSSPVDEQQDSGPQGMLARLIREDIHAAHDALQELRRLGTQIQPGAVHFATAAKLSAEAGKSDEALRWLALCTYAGAEGDSEKHVAASLEALLPASSANPAAAVKQQQQHAEADVIAAARAMLLVARGGFLRRSGKAFDAATRLLVWLVTTAGPLEQEEAASPQWSWPLWTYIVQADAQGRDVPIEHVPQQQQPSPLTLLFNRAVRSLALGGRAAEAFEWTKHAYPLAQTSVSHQQSAEQGSILLPFTAKVLAEELVAQSRESEAQELARRLLQACSLQLPGSKSCQRVVHFALRSQNSVSPSIQAQWAKHFIDERVQSQLLEGDVVGACKAMLRTIRHIKRVETPLVRGTRLHTLKYELPSSATLAVYQRAYACMVRDTEASSRQAGQRIFTKTPEHRERVRNEVVQLTRELRKLLAQTRRARDLWRTARLRNAVAEGKHALARQIWSKGFHDAGGVCEETRRVAFGETNGLGAYELDEEEVSPAYVRLRPGPLALKLMLRCMTQACKGDTARLEQLYNTWVHHAFPAHSALAPATSNSNEAQMTRSNTAEWSSIILPGDASLLPDPAPLLRAAPAPHMLPTSVHFVELLRPLLQSRAQPTASATRANAKLASRAVVQMRQRNVLPGEASWTLVLGALVRAPARGNVEETWKRAKGFMRGMGMGPEALEAELNGKPPLAASSPVTQLPQATLMAYTGFIRALCKAHRAPRLAAAREVKTWMLDAARARSEKDNSLSQTDLAWLREQHAPVQDIQGARNVERQRVQWTSTIVPAPVFFKVHDLRKNSHVAEALSILRATEVKMKYEQRIRAQRVARRKIEA